MISRVLELVYDVLAVSVIRSLEWSLVRKGTPVSARALLISVLVVKDNALNRPPDFLISC